MFLRLAFFLTFLTLIFLPAMAQKNDSYDDSWKKVTDFINENLPQSAREEVKKIYTKATLESNQPQQIKALVFEAQLVQQVEEDDWMKNIRLLTEEARQVKEPASQILHSILAQLYWNYFQNQRWRIYKRTGTVGFRKEDPDTWDATAFHQVIQSEFDSSLMNPSLLQKTRLDNYEPILIEGTQRRLRPTLYDLLVNEALDYYKTDEENITKPAYEFTLNDQPSLSPAKIFVSHQYKSQDSLSHEYRAIQLYQDWIRFHLSANSKDDLAQLVDADIARIQYAYQHQVNEGKERLYKEALEHIYTQYMDIPEAMQAGYLLADWWNKKGLENTAGISSKEEQNAFKTALQIAKEVYSKYPSSEGGIHSYNLINNIERSKLSVITENVNSINDPFRAVVNYANISALYLRLIKVNNQNQSVLETESDRVERTEDWEKVLAMQPVRSWQQPLPVMDDYRMHSCEIKVDGLPAGKYLLLGSISPDFGIEKNDLCSGVFYVSNIAFVNNADHYFILDRVSGMPLQGAKVQVYNQSYDYKARKYINVKAELLTTDQYGLVKVEQKNNARNIRLDIEYKNDRLFLQDPQYAYRNYDYNEQQRKLNNWEQVQYFTFTDRSIYRPGQKVYFKAIGILPFGKDGKKNDNTLFIPDKPVTVQLKDANYQVIDSLQLTANEFGSIHGSFMLPETGITGNYSLYIVTPQGSVANFNVEEYKRPKFYVSFDTLHTNYKLNQTIAITGNAKAFAGNNIDGATVKYRIHRNTRFIFPWLLYARKVSWPAYGRGNDKEITSGTTTTDADGKFHIDFTAMPDLGVDKSLDPAFDFTIEVDITDINGETRSNTETISVGYTSLMLQVTIPGGQQQDKDSLKSIKVSSTNLAGAHTPTPVHLNIYTLKTPTRLIRSRYWQKPDTAVMSYKEFVSYFPHDEYADESNPKSWETDQLIFEKNIPTSQLQTTVLLDYLDIKPGWLLIEAIAKDDEGKEVKTREWIAVHDYAKNIMASKEYNNSKVLKGNAEPGEKARFIQGTFADKIFVVQEIVKSNLPDNSQRNFQFYQIKKRFQQFEFAVNDEDRGGYSVSNFFVKDNRVYNNDWFINVPWTNKELTIAFETFRDKLLPGQEETWKVKISGSKADKVAAEMLASMYDASLDQFMTHSWDGLNIWRTNISTRGWFGFGNFTSAIPSSRVWSESSKQFNKSYDRLIRVNAGYMMRTMMAGAMSRENMKTAAAPPIQNDMSAGIIAEDRIADTQIQGETEKVLSATVDTENEKQQAPVSQQIRTNFNETAFFFPDLHSNDKGEISFSFTVPEALTEWKLQLLAHTKGLSTAFATRSVQTQKKLMVQPNAPRFFRHGDHLSLVTKVVNMSDEDISGTVRLELINSNTLENVDANFVNNQSTQTFSVKAGQSVSAAFPISIPMNYSDAVSYRIIAQSANASDGEEMALPVLTNRMLVTESFPINMRNTSSKTFTWDKLLQSGKSSTLQNKSLTVEYSSNPVWYAIQALPYLMEYPYDCAEQTWNRFYANALASHIANSMPKIKAVFDQWKNTADSAALLSNLQKNQELKAVLLEETPWVLQAKSEAEQKRNIALLFDMMRMARESARALNKIAELQSSNGGFSWFKGGPDDRYMTQYIVSGIGHLNKLNAMPDQQSNQLQQIIANALPYLDARIKEDYEYLLRLKLNLGEDHLSGTAIQYLYMRSFFTKSPVNDAKTAFDYYMNQAKKYWTKQSKYYQGMIALALYRNNDEATAYAILKSLKENSISNDEFGMYWKEFNSGGFYWWQAPIESHALLTEAFSEIGRDKTQVDDLKTWLLKQKQTNSWSSTRATAEACYALLFSPPTPQGGDAKPFILNQENKVEIRLGDGTIIKPENNAEAGTGYFKETITGDDVKPSMGKISVTIAPVSSSQIPPSGGGRVSWGAVYWQYFEDLDKISTAATPLSLKKDLFIIKNSDRGPVLTPISSSNAIHVGDKIKVRIELRSDRNLEYVHLKDMRASCFEPVNVLSQYKYQDGLGYYESTKDASTNFFISYLNKGTYVFEYELIATNKGTFSNGISSIQCMYAPEFSSHSEGIRLTVQ